MAPTKKETEERENRGAGGSYRRMGEADKKYD